MQYTCTVTKYLNAANKNNYSDSDNDSAFVQRAERFMTNALDDVVERSEQFMYTK